MAVYAQAPDFKVDPVGDFLGAFQATQNIFERKRRLSMEEERQNREAERLAKAELRAIDTHQKNMRSMEIANETNEYKLDQQREMDDTAAKSLKTFIEEANLLQQEAGAELVDPAKPDDPNEVYLITPDSQLRQKRLIDIQRKTAALQSRFATVVNHPVYGPQAQQYLGNIEQALVPHAEAMTADQAKDYNEFRGRLVEIETQVKPEERMNEFLQLQSQYSGLARSPYREDFLQAQKDATQRIQDAQKRLDDQIARERKLEDAEIERRRDIQATGDKEFMKAHVEYLRQDRPTIVKGIKDLEEIRDQLKAGDIKTGPLRALAPDFMKLELNQARDQVWSVVQGTLKATLGAQFTEREGEMILERSFNPSQTTGNNMERVQKFIDGLIVKRKEFDAMHQYFETNRTLQGYTPHSLDDKEETKESGLDLLNRYKNR